MHANRLEEQAKAELRHAKETTGDARSVVHKWVTSGVITRGRWNYLAAEVSGVEYKPHQRARGKPGIGEGPGTELAKIFASLGIPACQRCKNLARRMNRFGVAGCQKRRDEILAELRERQQRFGWAVKMKAAAMAAVTGLAFQIDWADPLASILDEAIRRAARA